MGHRCRPPGAPMLSILRYWFMSYYRTMATTSRHKLKQLLSAWPSAAPVSAAQLAALGVSADLAVYYVRAGWLQRLGRGVYCRPGEALALNPCLLWLQGQIRGLHVGGKTALDWYGVRHYLAQQPTLHLYGWDSAQLPDWFRSRFGGDHHRKRLFTEDPSHMPGVEAFERREAAPQVSCPERALLELLDEVGVRQPLQEAREITESAYALRADVLMDLLRRCTRIKTVRLCLALGRDLALPWSKQLDPSALPTGSARPWISRTHDGLLILKP